MSQYLSILGYIKQRKLKWYILCDCDRGLNSPVAFADWKSAKSANPSDPAEVGCPMSIRLGPASAVFLLETLDTDWNKNAINIIIQLKDSILSLQMTAFIWISLVWFWHLITFFHWKQSHKFSSTFKDLDALFLEIMAGDCTYQTHTTPPILTGAFYNDSLH